MAVSFQNGSYFSGSATVGTLTNSGGITSANLYNPDVLDRKYEYLDAKDAKEITYEGRDAAIETNISNIVSQLEKGHEDKAISAYNKLISEMSTQTRYASLAENEAQLRAVARQLIEQKSGYNLEELITKNASNSFERGFEINWNGDTLKEEDLLERMCDIDSTDRLTGAKQVAGVTCKVGVGVLGGAAAGAAIGAVFGGVGAVPGAIIGGALAAASTLI